MSVKRTVTLGMACLIISVAVSCGGGRISPIGGSVFKDPNSLNNSVPFAPLKSGVPFEVLKHHNERREFTKRKIEFWHVKYHLLVDGNVSKDDLLQLAKDVFKLQNVRMDVTIYSDKKAFEERQSKGPYMTAYKKGCLLHVHVNEQRKNTNRIKSMLLDVQRDLVTDLEDIQNVIRVYEEKDSMINNSRSNKVKTARL